jgi:hypothetical protein
MAGISYRQVGYWLRQTWTVSASALAGLVWRTRNAGTRSEKPFR